jgi:hypothetical protein
MQKIQLYIQGTRMDMFDDESVSITDTIKNVQDISKVFTAFSRSFNLPASKENNKIFKHYYNFDITGGFDARVRVSAEIQLNNISYKLGYVKLEGVSLKNNKAHTYKITFYGETISLKDTFGEDKLSSLSWLNNFSTKPSGDPLLFGTDDIRIYLTTNVSKTVDLIPYTNPIQVPLLTHTQRLFYDSAPVHNESADNVYFYSGAAHHHGVKWNELKYAIKIPIIVKAIEEQYGITFSTDFFNNTNTAYEPLYMWLHRNKGVITSGTGNTVYLVNDFATITKTISKMQNFGSASRLVPNAGLTNFGQRLTLTPTSPSNGVEYQFRILENGSTVYTSPLGTGVQTIFRVVPTGGKYTTIIIETASTITFSSIEWEVIYGPDIFGNTYLDTYTATSVSISADFEFIVTQQIPEIKVIDFISGLFKMFNLVAYIEDDIIVVKALDDFYSSGTSYDISQYIDVETSEVNAALPFREIIYNYEGTKTFLAAFHNQLFNQEWGTEDYTGDSLLNFAGEIYKVQLPFEHMKFERLRDVNGNAQTDIGWGYCVDDNQESYIGKPILFYLYMDNEDMSFVNAVDSAGVPTGHQRISNHFTPGNSNRSVLTNKPTINFSLEIDEYTGVTYPNTLFADYHEEYISEVFNQSKRLSVFTAYLPLRILMNYTLADRFVINNQSYKINSIKTNLLNGKSSLELLNE